MSQQDYDVIIIGAGIAGLVTANRAAQLGKRVAVLEKSTEEKYICNSRYAYGTFHINFTGLDTPEDTLLRQDRRGDRRLRAEGPGARRRQGRPPADAMAARAKASSSSISAATAPTCCRRRGATGYGLTWQNYGADIALQRLEANFSKRQGRILRGTRARALKLVPGGIEIEVEQADGVKKLSAPCGGDRRRRLPGQPRHAAREAAFRRRRKSCWRETAAPPSATAFAWRWRLGAAASGGMNNFYGHLHNRDAMQSTKHWPRPVTDDLAAAGIVIDAEGRRFTDEALGGIWICQRHRPPARPARHHDHLRPGDLGRPARPQPRAAAQSAGGRGRRHAASRRHAGGAGRKDRACRRSG